MDDRDLQIFYEICHDDSQLLTIGYLLEDLLDRAVKLVILIMCDEKKTEVNLNNMLYRSVTGLHDVISVLSPDVRNRHSSCEVCLRYVTK